jgi:hypothetical protein
MAFAKKILFVIINAAGMERKKNVKDNDIHCSE